MDYQTFKKSACSLLKDRLGDGYEVELTGSVRNNGVIRDVFSINRSGSNIKPVIDLEPFYQRYSNGLSLESVVGQIKDYFFMVYPKEDFEMSDIMDPEKMSSRIVYRLVNYEKNKGFLENVPHRRYLDLALIYSIEFESEQTGKSSVIVRNSILNCWKMEADCLDALALENTGRLKPVTFMPIHEAMRLFAGEKKLSYQDLDIERMGECMPVFVLSNKDFFYGAYWMTDSRVMDGICELLKDDLIVLPSSVHECLVMPAGFSVMDSKELYEMVHDVNSCEVADQDILADSVYSYRKGSGELQLCA